MFRVRKTVITGKSAEEKYRGEQSVGSGGELFRWLKYPQTIFVIVFVLLYIFFITVSIYKAELVVFVQHLRDELNKKKLSMENMNRIQQDKLRRLQEARRQKDIRKVSIDDAKK